MVPSLKPKRHHDNLGSIWLRTSGKVAYGAGGGTWTLTDLAVQRIFLPAAAFAAPAFLPQGLGSGLSLHRARIWLRVSGAARL